MRDEHSTPAASVKADSSGNAVRCEHNKIQNISTTTQSAVKGITRGKSGQSISTAKLMFSLLRVKYGIPFMMHCHGVSNIVNKRIIVWE
jgi:hypothetical protein